MTIESTLERIATALETLAAAPKTEATEAPKVKRGKAAAAATDTAASAPQTAAAAEPAAPASATDKETDDLFGEDPVAEEPKKEKVKELTIDDVRAKLVEAQTKLKSKDKAIALLSKVAGSPVLSALKKEDYLKLIGECDAAIKAAG